MKSAAVEIRSECPSSAPSCSGSFARGLSLHAGRGQVPAQSLPLSHVFRPEVILLLSLFPPGDGDAPQSHEHLSRHCAPKFTFPVCPLCLSRSIPQHPQSGGCCSCPWLCSLHTFGVVLAHSRKQGRRE